MQKTKYENDKEKYSMFNAQRSIFNLKDRKMEIEHSCLPAGREILNIEHLIFESIIFRWF
jgi:hypothetical protein